MKLRFWASAPSVAVEIAPNRVTAVALDRDGGRPVVGAYAIEALPAGAVRPTVGGPNLADAAAVESALTRALDRLGRRRKRVALVIPDAAAKVSLLRFDHVPARARDLDQLVKWQIRKTAPFRIEDAQIAYTPGVPLPDGGREFVVALVRRDIVEEYERACAAAGVYAGLVDLATFNLVNAVLAGSAATAASAGSQIDWLLVNVTADYCTIVVVRGSDPIVFRNRTAEGDGSLADLVHQTAMYYEDRLGGAGFARVLVVGAAGGATPATTDELHRTLEDRLGVTVEAIDPRQAAPLRDRITASADLLDALAAPVGILLRERRA